MKVLLINHHPVVSRLLELALKNNIAQIDTVDTLSGIKLKKYDFVFLDESANNDALLEKLSKSTKVTTIFISYTSEQPNGFDFALKKPFLPEQVMRIVKSVSLTNNSDEIPSILDIDEIDRIKDILKNEESIEKSGETQYKHDAIKQSIIDNGLEVLNEDELVESTLNDSKFSVKELELIESAIRDTIHGLKPKKIKKLLKGKSVEIKLKIEDVD